MLTSCAQKASLGAPWLIQYLFTKRNYTTMEPEAGEERTIVQELLPSKLLDEGVHTRALVRGNCGAIWKACWRGSRVILS